MIELKVVCDCGQKFKFDVEPVNGQMPFTVACPICKRDGTAKANAMLQQMSVFKMVEPPPPPAPAPAPIAPIAPPPPAPSRLRLNVSAPAAAHTTSTDAPPPIAPALTTSPPPISGRARMAPAATPEQSGKKPSFGMGL